MFVNFVMFPKIQYPQNLTMRVPYVFHSLNKSRNSDKISAKVIKTMATFLSDSKFDFEITIYIGYFFLKCWGLSRAKSVLQLVYTCKNWSRYSRERTSQSMGVIKFICFASFFNIRGWLAGSVGRGIVRCRHVDALHQCATEALAKTTVFISFWSASNG